MVTFDEDDPDSDDESLPEDEEDEDDELPLLEVAEELRGGIFHKKY
jgi:hypothetical protein